MLFNFNSLLKVQLLVIENIISLAFQIYFVHDHEDFALLLGFYQSFSVLTLERNSKNNKYIF